MNKITLALAVFCAATGTIVSTPSTASPPTNEPSPSGFYCGFTAVTDPNPEADANDMTGEVDAGPATTEVSGTMECSIQVNSNVHVGADAAVRVFTSDANGIIVGVQAVSYSTTEDAVVYMCTSFVIHNGPGTADDVRIYFTVGVGWHEDPGRECSQATSGGTQDVWDIVDGLLCPELRRYHPAGWPASNDDVYIDHEGDVFVDVNNDGIHENQAPVVDSSDAMADLFYDCPDYTFTINNPDANPDRDHDAHYDTPATGRVIDGP